MVLLRNGFHISKPTTLPICISSSVLSMVTGPRLSSIVTTGWGESYSLGTSAAPFLLTN